MPEQGTPAGRGWSRGERIVTAAGALLAADLLALPWHRYSLDLSAERFGVQVPSFRIDRTAVEDPYALLGIAALVVAALMVLHIVGAKLTPALPRPGQLHLVGGAVVLGLVVAKLLANNEFLGTGAYVGAALAAGVAYGGLVLSRETARAPGMPPVQNGRTSTG
jgi:hypothetical protein